VSYFIQGNSANLIIGLMSVLEQKHSLLGSPKTAGYVLQSDPFPKASLISQYD